MSIKIINLCKKYNDNIVLDNINLEIKKGSIFGLLGPNGAGKSTLVSILNNILNKDSGTIEFFGKDFDKNTSYVKSMCSFVPQTYAFYTDLSPIENLEFFAALYGLKGSLLKERISYCMDITSLHKYSNKKSSTLSGGVKRRLNIAIGLLNNPEVLYLDEPTVGIDPQSRNYILKMIKNINKQNNLTIIYTSHYMEEIEYLCDDIAILDKSTIILHEKKKNLLNTKELKIELQDNTIKTFDVTNSYDSFLNFIKEQDGIKNIDFKHKNLEDMFLELTKQDLRD